MVLRFDRMFKYATNASNTNATLGIYGVEDSTHPYQYFQALQFSSN